MVPSLALSHRVGAAEKELIPKKMPFPPNDEFGSYEPTITPDGNTIYFARFAGSGDKRVLGTTTDIFVTHRIRHSGEWPGTGADWTPPERLPDTVNSDSIDQEPRITPDGKTLYFMSRRSGNADIWVTHKQPNGEWTKAQHPRHRALLHAARPARRGRYVRVRLYQTQGGWRRSDGGPLHHQDGKGRLATRQEI
jgi:hypothetical protein